MVRALFYIHMTAAGTMETITPRITANNGVGAVNLDGSPCQRHGWPARAVPRGALLFSHGSTA